MLMAMICCVHFAVFNWVIVYYDVYINSDFVIYHYFKQNNSQMIIKFWIKTTLGINRDDKTHICMQNR